MTPLPKKKHSRSRSNQRKHAATERLQLVNLVICTNCKKLRVNHQACSYCGYYK